MIHPVLRHQLLNYARLRSLLFAGEGVFIPLVDFLINRKRPRFLTDDPELFRSTTLALDELLTKDIENIENGIYPAAVLMPESPIRHMLRIPRLFTEGIRAGLRKANKQSQTFSREAQEFFTDVPEYYRRNFHFQDNGYLSGRSAELYEHQVEVLFAGAADAMRRLIIAPMKKHFKSSDGSGLTFLELGAGTGRATRFVRLAFPKAKIVAVDLSEPYLKQAQTNLKAFSRHDFLQSDAANLPFESDTFDAVYSVFLFHEVPEAEREKIWAETSRVLKSGGFAGCVDALQLKDVTEFDQALLRFPQEYHEPFFKNYIQHPLENYLTETGFENIQTETGFFSKCSVGRKRAVDTH